MQLAMMEKTNEVNSASFSAMNEFHRFLPGNLHGRKKRAANDRHSGGWRVVMHRLWHTRPYGRRKADRYVERKQEVKERKMPYGEKRERRGQARAKISSFLRLLHLSNCTQRVYTYIHPYGVCRLSHPHTACLLAAVIRPSASQTTKANGLMQTRRRNEKGEGGKRRGEEKSKSKNGEYIELSLKTLHARVYDRHDEAITILDLRSDIFLFFPLSSQKSQFEVIRCVTGLCNREKMSW